MTTLLEQVFAQIKQLPQEDQYKIAKKILKSLNHNPSSNDDRETTFEFTKLLSEFNNLEGYYNLSNTMLASELKELTLLGENLKAENKVSDTDKIYIYKKWSFTFSFMQMLNAWQWFFAGILLQRNSHLKTQAMQMYYYSIFFAYGSFLSAQFKGHYTLADVPKKTNYQSINNMNNEVSEKIKNEMLRLKGLGRIDTESYLSSINNINNIQNLEMLEPARRYVWLAGNQKTGNYIYVQARKEHKGGEHERRAEWYYQVFNSWENKINIFYPEVRYFKENHDNKFHTDNRNRYTYSIQFMVDELYEEYEDSALTNKGIICLWQRKSDDLTKDLSDMYSLEFWALQHIKVVVDLHTKLLEGYTKGSPYTQEQERLLTILCDHHRRTGLFEVLKVAMPKILEKIGIEIE
jgi:hypothetical protein